MNTPRQCTILLPHSFLASTLAIHVQTSLAIETNIACVDTWSRTSNTNAIIVTWLPAIFQHPISFYARARLHTFVLLTTSTCDEAIATRLHWLPRRILLPITFDTDTLDRLLQDVCSGTIRFPDVSHTLFSSSAYPALSEEEQILIAAFAWEYSFADCANLLHFSNGWIEQAIKRLYRKTGTTTKTQLVAFTLGCGLVPFEVLGRIPAKNQQPEAKMLSPSYLTEEENVLLTLIVAGKTNSEIARLLGKNIHTVRQHTSALYTRLGVSSRLGAIRSFFLTSPTPFPSCYN